MPDEWERGEGDRWWERNKRALLDPAHIAHDPVLRMLDTIPPPREVLEVGCANGWRLDAIYRRYGADCYGIDVSEDAINDGRRRYFPLTLAVAPSHNWPFGVGLDAVIFSFVLHWVDRRNLAYTIAEADDALQDGGHIVIADFLPDVPSKRRYHHRSDVELYTYKQDYAQCFTALGTYQEIRREVFDHDTGEVGDCSPASRAAVVLLRKGEVYRCG